ncbi:MAG: transglycosylase domain-containing protein [Magnetococcales bacterium]|nr:transglycosylase domain-containing protein [Magnetococcales bacterium]
MFQYCTMMMRRIPCKRLAVWSAVVATLVVLGLALFRSDFQTPSPSRFLLDRHGRFLAQIGGHEPGGFGYWHQNAWSQRVVDAVLITEDRRFWRHPGVDPLAVLRAMWQNLRGSRRISGASTLAMQLARMQHPGPRTLPRKIVEAVTALLLTARHGRQAVLNHYLTWAPYGNRSHGLAHAARLYFSKRPIDLSWAEIAFLAAIPQSPARMNPFTLKGRERAIGRGKRILDALQRAGRIEESDLVLARDQIAHLSIQTKPHRPPEAMHAILRMERMFSYENMRGGAPLIHSTLDLNLQRHTAHELEDHLQQWRSAGAEQGAVIVRRVGDRQMLAWVGSGNYYTSPAGSIDYGAVPRASGSVLKPFLFAKAIEDNVISSGTILDDLRAAAPDVVNADRRYQGPLLPRQALANSRNVPAVHLLRQVGLSRFNHVLRRLGLHQGQRDPRHYGLGMALGGLPVTLEALSEAYGVLSGDGLLRSMIWYKGQPLHSGEKVRIFSTAVVRLVTKFLADPMARLPAFPRMGSTEYPFPVALKTGTSQGFRDAWVVAYSPSYQVAVWIGRSDATPMRKLGGGQSAALLARSILLHLHQGERDGLNASPFPAPEGYRQVPICAWSGGRNDGRCQRGFPEWFPEEYMPPLDHSRQRLEIDRRNGLLAGHWTPREEVQPRLFYRFAPRYAEWAQQAGLSSPPARFSALNAPDGISLVDLSMPGTRDMVAQSGRAVRLSITAPESGQTLFLGPDAARLQRLLMLRVTVDPPVPQVVWYVDGRPFKLAPPPYTVRWPLQAGEHTFQVQLPFRDVRSERVKLTIRP